MKKFLFIIIFVLSLINFGYCHSVTEQKAKEVGLKFMKSNTSIKSINNCKLAYKITSEDGIITSLYVFNLDDKGFVVVSGEDIAIPILGYSTNGKFVEKEAPIALIEYLKGFDEAIQNAIKLNITASSETTQEWLNIQQNGFLRGNIEDSVIVAPLVTTLWNQIYPYNKQCPMDIDGPGGHVYTGCTSTAMAMIIEYWEFPRTGQGSHSYKPNNYPTQSVNYSNAVYNYANMPDQLTVDTALDKINEVAKLLWHCGVSIDSDYGINGTSAYPSDVPNAMKTYYKYNSGTNGKNRNNYSISQWKTMLKTSLDNEIPLHYSGWNSSGGGGHSFICDGYNSNDYFHFNWGWDGAYNGFYSLDAMIVGNYNFSYNNYAVFDAYPPADSCTAPSNLITTIENTNNVLLSWDESIYAKEYNIYRNEELIATSYTNSYTDNDVPNGNYVYYVNAICKFGLSDNSNESQINIQFSSIPGDANGDSQVNISDITVIISYLLNKNPSPFIFANSDVNNDNLVNILDVILIINIIQNNK